MGLGEEILSEEVRRNRRFKTAKRDKTRAKRRKGVRTELHKTFGRKTKGKWGHLIAPGDSTGADKRMRRLLEAYPGPGESKDITRKNREAMRQKGLRDKEILEREIETLKRRRRARYRPGTKKA